MDLCQGRNRFRCLRNKRTSTKMTHNGEDPPHPPVSMLAVCSRTSSRAKCAFISQRLSPPKNPATLKSRMRGGVWFGNVPWTDVRLFRKHRLPIPTEFRGNKWCCPGNTPWALVGPFPLAKETSPEAKASGAGPAPDASEGGRFPRPRGGAQRRRLPRGRFPCPKGGVQLLAQRVGYNHGPTGEAQLGPN